MLLSPSCTDKGDASKINGNSDFVRDYYLYYLPRANFNI